MGWWILIVVIVVIAIFLVITYNRLVSLRQIVSQAWADVSVQLKQRHDQRGVVGDRCRVEAPP